MWENQCNVGLQISSTTVGSHLLSSIDSLKILILFQCKTQIFQQRIREKIGKWFIIRSVDQLNLKKEMKKIAVGSIPVDNSSSLFLCSKSILDHIPIVQWTYNCWYDNCRKSEWKETGKRWKGAWTSRTGKLENWTTERSRIEDIQLLPGYETSHSNQYYSSIFPSQLIPKHCLYILGMGNFLGYVQWKTLARKWSFSKSFILRYQCERTRKCTSLESSMRAHGQYVQREDLHFLVVLVCFPSCCNHVWLHCLGLETIRQAIDNRIHSRPSCKTWSDQFLKTMIILEPRRNRSFSTKSKRVVR